MLRFFKTYILSVFAAAILLSFSSCESMFDSEGDCTTKYRIKFVYDMNLKWADAFPSEVQSVNLYVFDSKGKFVKEFDVDGEELSQPGFYIEFDDETIVPGNYTFVAWCGLVNEGVAMQSFTVSQPIVGETTIEELTCMLNVLNSRATQIYQVYSDTRLYFMYHGMLTANLPNDHNGLTYEYTVRLTKDTNHIRIVLQELSGDDMNANDYDIKIEAANGCLAYNNALMPNNPVVTYLPWAQQADLMELGNDDGTIKYNHGLVADFTTSRMMESQLDKFMLTVSDNKSNDKIIASVPILQYALLAKDYYAMAYNRVMTDQEFLDREDEYVLTFFLYGNKWVNTHIEVNSWRVVLHDYDIKN